MKTGIIKRGLKLLAGAAICGLITGSAIAGNTNCTATIHYVDIHGIVTVNGVPTGGVEVTVMCCDTCSMLSCTNADPLTAADGSYVLSFNDTANGGFCNGGCSSGAICFGSYTPWNVFLQFVYQGCTQYVACVDVLNAYLAGN